jgi:hypothetical protein
VHRLAIVVTAFVTTAETIAAGDGVGVAHADLVVGFGFAIVAILGMIERAAASRNDWSNSTVEACVTPMAEWIASPTRHVWMAPGEQDFFAPVRLDPAITRLREYANDAVTISNHLI